MPAPKTGQPSAGGSAPKPGDYVMPKPLDTVVWSNAPGGESYYALVTKVGRNAISLMVFPTESRVGVPKESVRFISDPWNAKNGVNADAGVWDFTDEQKLLQFVVGKLVADKVVTPEPSNSHLFARYCK